MHGAVANTSQLIFSRIFDDGNLSNVVPDVATMSIVCNKLKVIPQVANAGVNINFGNATTSGMVYKIEIIQITE